MPNLDTQRVQLLAVKGGFLSAILFLSASLGEIGGIWVAFPVFFTQFPLYLVGLSLGTYSAFLASMIATLTITAIKGLYGQLTFTAVIGFVGWRILPVLALVRQSLLWRQTQDEHKEWYPSGLLLAWVTVLSSCLLLYLILDKEVIIQFEKGFDLFNERSSTGSEILFKEIKTFFMTYFPGLFAVWWMLTTIGNIVLAQKLLEKMSYNLRPAFNFLQAQLPYGFHMALGIALGILLITDNSFLTYLSKNLLFVLCVPFFIVGLGAIHDFCHRFKEATLILGAFYFFMFIFSYLVLLVTLIGIFRSWTNLHRRLMNKSNI